jgi:hypothetical protein
MAMVKEVEAAVDPEAVFLNCYVGLRIDGPVSRLGDDAADFWITVGGYDWLVRDSCLHPTSDQSMWVVGKKKHSSRFESIIESDSLEQATGV